MSRRATSAETIDVRGGLGNACEALELLRDTRTDLRCGLAAEGRRDDSGRVEGLGLSPAARHAVADEKMDDDPYESMRLSGPRARGEHEVPWERIDTSGVDEHERRV